jgi:hypothetical protein
MDDRALRGVSHNQCTWQAIRAGAGDCRACTSPTAAPRPLCGRRAGKSLVLALTAVFLACFHSWQPYLAPGSCGVILDLQPVRFEVLQAVDLRREDARHEDRRDGAGDASADDAGAGERGVGPSVSALVLAAVPEGTQDAMAPWRPTFDRQCGSSQWPAPAAHAVRILAVLQFMPLAQPTRELQAALAELEQKLHGKFSCPLPPRMVASSRLLRSDDALLSRRVRTARVQTGEERMVGPPALPSGAPANKINDLGGRLAALAAVVSGSSLTVVIESTAMRAESRHGYPPRCRPGVGLRLQLTCAGTPKADSGLQRPDSAMSCRWPVQVLAPKHPRQRHDRDRQAGSRNARH